MSERVAAAVELAGLELEAYQLAEFTGSRYVRWHAQRVKYRLARFDKLRAELSEGP